MLHVVDVAPTAAAVYVAVTVATTVDVVPGTITDYIVTIHKLC